MYKDILEYKQAGAAGKLDYIPAAICAQKLEEVHSFLYKMYGFCTTTAMHSIRVSTYSMEIGLLLNLESDDMLKLWVASILHDAGKLAVPYPVLNKHGRLTMEEFELMKDHSFKGFEAVRRMEGFEEEAVVVLFHHERYDGGGYPNRLSGIEIPFLSKIITVADAYDAMTSERPYRKAIRPAAALRELEEGRWSQFDGEVVDAFIYALNCKNTG